MNFENIGNRILRIEETKLQCTSFEQEGKTYVTNGRNKSQLLTNVTMCYHKNLKVAFSKSFWGEKNVERFRQAYENHTELLYAEAVIDLEKECIYRFTWDDVRTGRCSIEQLNMVERDQDRRLVFHKTMKVFVPLDGLKNIPNKLQVSIKNELIKEACYEEFKNHYLEIDSHEFNSAIRFKNNYTEVLERRRKEALLREAENEDILYEAYEEQKYLNYGLDEEGSIMDALENGDAEIYGF